MAPTKSAGRVSIRVLPDSSRFREDLKKTLDRIEKTVKAEIPVHLKLGREQIRAIQAQLKEAMFQIKPHIDLQLKRDEVERIQREIEAMRPKVDIDTDLNTKAAAARIANLTRDRTLRVWVKTMGGNFARHIAALGGLGFIAEEVNRGLRYLREIDKNAVILARQAALFGSIIATVGTATQGVLALGDGIIKTTGLLLVAPALLSSIAIATAVFIAALKDMGEVFADLKPQFGELRQMMSANFWKQAEKPIRLLVRDLFPTMSEQINESARAMGYLVGQMAASYRAHVTPERLALMWGRVNESMWTVTRAVDPIMEAFTTLGLHGTKYLNRLSESIVRLSEDFNNWIQINDQNGNLEKWTEDAIQAFKDLGGVIKGTWNVFGALNRAVKVAGGPTLASLHKSLDDLALLMNSPRVQKALVHTFRGMNDATREILAGIGEMGRGYAKLAPSVEIAFGSLGGAVRTLLGYFGDIMAHPIFQKGFRDLFAGLEGGIKNLKPAIEPTAIALGSLLTLMGHILERLGGLIGLIMEKWGPALQRLSDEFDTLVDPVMDLVEAIVINLTPAVEALIDKGLIPLLGWLRDELIPVIKDWVNKYGPDMERLFVQLGDIIGILLPILSWLLQSFVFLAGGVMDFLSALGKLSDFLKDPNNNPILIFAKFVAQEGPKIESTFKSIGETFKTRVGTAIGESLDELMRQLWGFELMFGQSWETNLAVLRQNLDEMGISTQSWGNFFLSIWDLTLGRVYETVSGKMGETALETKRNLDIMGIDTSTVWTTIEGVAARIWGTIQRTIGSNMQGATGSLGQELNRMAFLARFIWDQIKREITQRVGDIGRGVQSGFRDTINFIQGIPKTIETIFNLDWSYIGRSIIGGIVDGMWSMLETAAATAREIVARIRAYFPSSPAKLGPFSGTGYTTYSGAKLMKDWAGGMKSEMGTVKQVAGKAMSTVQSQLAGVATASGEEIEAPANGNVTMNVYNPVREPTSRTVAKTAAEIRLGGTIG